MPKKIKTKSPREVMKQIAEEGAWDADASLLAIAKAIIKGSEDGLELALLDESEIYRDAAAEMLLEEENNKDE